jgi:hypothetical protein
VTLPIPAFSNPFVSIYHGDSWALAPMLAPQSINCIVTSPPYWGLRDYGEPGQFGLESTPEEYVARLVDLFRLLRPALRDDGTLWLNLGDSYASAWACNRRNVVGNGSLEHGKREDRPNRLVNGLKEKDLVGIPWRVAFALQADGWWLRSDIIWCLSGGTWLYAHTQKGDMPIMVRDLARLQPETVKLWNGEKWTQLLGINRNHRGGDEIEFVLRSGERISCTPTHRFPTQRGILVAGEIKVGDKLQACRLPQPENPRDCALDEDAAWFAGLYLAEGSRSGDKIQIAGHVKETERWERCDRIARKYGGSAHRDIDGNCQNIRMYGKVLNAIIDEFVGGKTATDKGFATVVWRYSDAFIAAMLDGYLSGDAHRDAKNDRWRLGFTRNYNLERDLRTACARLGYKLKLTFNTVEYDGKQVPTFCGEIRKVRSGHHNEKCMTEVVEIRKARCREVYDLGVADEPHLFALASGVLTHNSKPNPMPESVTDRPTKAHEYIFLLSKGPKYYFDAQAIKEPVTSVNPKIPWRERTYGTGSGVGELNGEGSYKRGTSRQPCGNPEDGLRNKRSVWTVATQSFSAAHFATFPPELIRPCILAGAPERCCPECGAPWERVVEKESHVQRERGKDASMYRALGQPQQAGVTTTKGFIPTCTCGHEPIGGTVLDPFMGSGTTAAVARKLGRRAVGFELNADYIQIAAEHRLSEGMLF